MQVDVDRYPAWPEAIEIESWVAAAGKSWMRCDWVMRSFQTGQVLARATRHVVHDERHHPAIVQDPRRSARRDRAPLHVGESLRIRQERVRGNQDLEGGRHFSGTPKLAADVEPCGSGHEPARKQPEVHQLGARKRPCGAHEDAQTGEHGAGIPARMSQHRRGGVSHNLQNQHRWTGE